MRGKYDVTVEDVRVKFVFTVNRNITIIRGNSGTGKTTLINMLDAAAESDSTTVRCNVPCIVIHQSNFWIMDIQQYHNSILFFDEDCKFLKSKEFANVVKQSDCYFVIITRNDLESLPYSVDEIYEIHESKRYAGLKKTVNIFVRRYQDRLQIIQPDEIITEDSNSGFQFFKEALPDIDCVSAHGKSNIYRILGHTQVKEALVIIDGAAFGSCMTDTSNIVAKKQIQGVHIYVFAPESFEWLILRSKLFYNKCKKELDNSADYIDSHKYISWERYFTNLLIYLTSGTPATYTKSELNQYYLTETAKREILKIVDCIDTTAPGQ